MLVVIICCLIYFVAFTFTTCFVGEKMLKKLGNGLIFYSVFAVFFCLAGTYWSEEDALYFLFEIFRHSWFFTMITGLGFVGFSMEKSGQAGENK